MLYIQGYSLSDKSKLSLLQYLCDYHTTSLHGTMLHLSSIKSFMTVHQRFFFIFLFYQERKCLLSLHIFTVSPCIPLAALDANIEYNLCIYRYAVQYLCWVLVYSTTCPCICTTSKWFEHISVYLSL